MSTTFPFIPRMDRRYLLVGDYHNGITTWRLPQTDPLVNAIVLSDAFGDDAGSILTPDGSFGDEVSLEGDYTAGRVMLGRLFDASLDLSRPFARDFNGRAKAHGLTETNAIRTSHHRTGQYTIRMDFNRGPSRNYKAKQFTAREVEDVVLPEDDGTFRASFTGRADLADVSIESDSALPFTIVGVEWEINFEPLAGGR